MIKSSSYLVSSAAFIAVIGLFGIGCVASASDATDTAAEALSRSKTRCVDAAARKLGIDYDTATSPALLAEILHDDMRLDDLASVPELLGPKLTQPQPLRPMFDAIRNAIPTKQPALNQFLCAAVDEGLLASVDADGARTVARAAHHTFLLDALTKAMFEDWTFMAEVHAHLLQKRQELGIRGDFLGSSADIYRVTGDIFQPVKMKTLDWVMDQYETERARGSLTTADVLARRNSLTLNIIEATVTDYHRGYRDNGDTGVALAINPTRNVVMDDEHRALYYDLSQEWTSLYESWNLAFITGNLVNLNILYPKLFIPQVIAASSDEYMFKRALALWTSGNFFLFAKLSKPDVVIANRDALARRWGQINVVYARDYVARHNGGRKLRGISDLLTIPGAEIKNALRMWLYR